MKYATLTPQQFYDKTVEGLRAQGGPSMGFPPGVRPSRSKPICLYRSTVNGEKRKCAAGLHITDEEYKAEIERHALTRTFVSTLFNDDPYHPLRVHLSLARSLQDAHDRAAGETDGYYTLKIREGDEFFKHLEPKLRNVAITHNLFYTPPRNHNA